MSPRAFSISVAAAAVLLALSVISWVRFDRELMAWMNGWKGPILDVAFVMITWLGSLAVLAPLTIVIASMLIRAGRRMEARLMAIGVGGAVLAVFALKRLVHRPRPNLFPPVIPLPSDPSFPSGHAAQVGAACICLFLIVRQLRQRTGSGWYGAVAAALTATVGISRIYLQVHYPSDVLAGVAIALLWCAGVARFGIGERSGRKTANTPGQCQ
jgi:undecaprenyl-diphosphatase